MLGNVPDRHKSGNTFFAENAIENLGPFRHQSGMKNRIAEIRKKKQLRQRHLAEHLGCDTSTVSKIETGKRQPRLSVYEAIAEYLGVTFADLFDKNELDVLRLALSARATQLTRDNLRAVIAMMDALVESEPAIERQQTPKLPAPGRH